jgi:hypothetical protein
LTEECGFSLPPNLPLGDPAILLPDLFPEWGAEGREREREEEKGQEREEDISSSSSTSSAPPRGNSTNPSTGGKCFVAHASDRGAAPALLSEGTPPGDPLPTLISPIAKSWRDVVSKISSCSLVYSSSLHGIIVAESLGIPARWVRDDRLKSTKGEGLWKYNDYYLSTGRPADNFAASVAAALREKEAPPLPDLGPMRKRLRAAFPPPSSALLTSPAACGVGGGSGSGGVSDSSSKERGNTVSEFPVFSELQRGAFWRGCMTVAVGGLLGVGGWAAWRRRNRIFI